MAPVESLAAPGFRTLKDIYPDARGMGLSYYPYSSVYNGLNPTWTATQSTGTPKVPAAQTVAISAGQAYLDSELSTLAAGVSLVVNPNTLGVLPGSNYYHIFLNPTRRLVPIVRGSSAPTTLLNGVAVANGDKYALCNDLGEYLTTDTFYKRVSGQWVDYNPVFEAPPVPAQKGKNRTWGGESSPVVALSNFSVNAVEKKVYVGTKYPPYTSSNSMAELRDCASLHIATLILFYDTDGASSGAGSLLTATSSLVINPNFANP